MTTRLYSLLAVVVFAIMLLFVLAFSPPATDANVNVVTTETVEMFVAEKFESLDGTLVTGTIYVDPRPDTYQGAYGLKQPAELSLTADYRCHNWRSSVAA